MSEFDDYSGDYEPQGDLDPYEYVDHLGDDLLETDVIAPREPVDDFEDFGAGPEDEDDRSYLATTIEEDADIHAQLSKRQLRNVRTGKARVLMPRHASKYERPHLIQLMIKRIDSGMILDRRVIDRAREMHPSESEHDKAMRCDSLTLATIAIDMALDPSIKLDMNITLERDTFHGYEPYNITELPEDPSRYGTMNMERQMQTHLNKQLNLGLSSI